MEVALVVAPNSSHLARISGAVSLINACQRFYRLSLTKNSILAQGSGDVNAAALCTKWQAGKGRTGKWILITESSLDDNWFSHEYRECAVISIADWEQLYAPPSLRSYLIYQIAQALIHFEADMSEEMAMNMVHQPAKACIYDLVAHKPEIKYGMVAGNICSECVARLRALGAKPEAIGALVRILEVVRSEALGASVVLDPREAFVVMRFTENDENDNAWKYGIRPGAQRRGLRVVRADNHVESGQILDKVERHIARSRLVIAKVDSDNLNVFFELGLAMGMKKDVLLVSDDALVLSLPSDLRNWECLVYKKGNYEQLADRVSAFLEATYGLTAHAEAAN